MKPYKLLNYTSGVPAEKSIADIERALSRAGATKVAKDYSGDGTVVAFFFSIPTGHGDMVFRMPCDVDKVFTVFMADIKRPHANTEKNMRDKASRVAWRILLDWIQAQIAMIKLQQVKPQQAFLPYAYDARTKQTLFDRLESSGYKLLGTGE